MFQTIEDIIQHYSKKEDKHINDNDDNDYAEEEGKRSVGAQLQRRLINADRDYPDSYHENDCKPDQE